MDNKLLESVENLLRYLSAEAKLAFIDRFSYLKITEMTANRLVTDEILYNMSKNDGAILVHVKGHLVIPFSALKSLLFDKTIAPYNYEIKTVYQDGRVFIALQRFYYHTKKKTIFNM